MAEQLVGLLRGVTKVAIIVTLLLVTLPPTAIYHVFTYLYRRPPYSLKRHVIANLMRVAGTNASRVTLPPRDATAAMIPKNKYTTSPEWTVEVRMVQPLDADVPRLPIIKQVGDKVKGAPVPVFMVAPAGTDLFARAAPGERVVLHTIGGAYVGGHPLSEHIVFNMTKVMKGRLCTVNYRKSLDDASAFPGSLLDSLAGWQFLIKLGFEPKNITLAGESAGGNACLALMRYLDDLQQSGYDKLGLAGGMLLSAPWSDLTSSFPSIQTNKHSDILFDLTAACVPSHIRHYGKGAARGPYFSPALHPNDEHWRHLAQAGVIVHINGGDAEAFFDEISSVVRAMKTAGVDVTFLKLPNGVHTDYVLKDLGILSPDIGYTWPAVKQDWIEYFEALDKRGY
ncbi:uncharacterized protein EHS24_006639 [Apiotrichum porosum]|uniref:Alpha/beta hydrolase fold-3 domain-containing protein n=1 Tax=Apiotrichum porosum TaxID=105984 RepID=A0A427Y1W6_9TREE|nr:uncharacterized protein EHS24_006639 [Apiotrichum porosum]RSH85050.1 hypothetical protein EHS24_006639 [Apiotrichum porosum]